MKLEINIPTELREIKLMQYQKFLDIAKNNPDSEFLQQKMVQIFCGIDLKDVAQIKYNTVEEITANIISMFTKEHKFINRFKLGGIEFGFIPNLEDITLDEYVDITTYINDFDNMHKVMAVLFRPITNKIGNKYEIEPYKSTITYSEVMLHAPLDAVLGAVVFFYHLANELVISSVNYLERHKEELNIVSSHNLANGGDGITAIMLSLKETSETLRRSVDFNFLPL
ncbi:MAG: hypothetical protein H7239_10190 [Flavobacterium sp.]|nr:hypothetical protein [Flavobacterium sp.]